MKQFLISPPFGNILRHRGCTPIVGTFTWEARGSNLTKLYRLIKTTRRVAGGWRNRVGLQNPGIRTIKVFHPEYIYSIAAINDGDWHRLAEFIPAHTAIELNLSCPNLDHQTTITDTEVTTFVKKFKTIVAKLSPTTQYLSDIKRLRQLGITRFHVFNTIPTEKGGVSGKQLKQHSLSAVKTIKETFPELNVIAGGGVYSKTDVDEYLEVGADHVSLSSVFLSPLKAWRLLRNISE